MHEPTVQLRAAPITAQVRGAIQAPVSPSLRRLPALIAIALLVATVVIASFGGDSPARLPHAPASALLPASTSLLALPAASRGPVSATLGASDRAYRVMAKGAGFKAATPAQHLKASFTRSGVTLRSGAAGARLALQAIGFGSALTPVSAVAPRASANRVTYRRPGLSEWYVNGPLGLEQGFTLSAPPRSAGHGPLTLAIGLGGRATLSGQTLLFQRHGRPVLRYGGLRANDASGRTLPAHMELVGRRLLLRVDASHARYPLTIDPLIQQGPKLTGGSENGTGYFGYSVALSADGNTALVGGYGDGANVGAAWVFTRSNSTWTQQGPKLTAAGEGGKGLFGLAVALSGDGNTALISAPADKFTSKIQEQTGSVRVFTRSAASWSEAAKLEAGVGGANDGFGTSLAISADGSTAAVGAPNDDEKHGGVWVFEQSAGAWTLHADLTGCEKLEGAPAKCVERNEEGAEADLGASLAVSSDGSTIVAGAPEDEGGSMWVFIRIPEVEHRSYTQEGKKKVPSGSPAKARFGTDVALSSDGNTALIGGPGDNSGIGAVWAFTRSEHKWEQQGSKLTPTGTSGPGEFGYSVALSADGNTALVGAPLEQLGEEGEPGHLEEEGSVWRFTRAGGVWTQAGGKLLAAGAQQGNGPLSGSEIGFDVALSDDGETALAGAPEDNVGHGGVWVFSTATGPIVKEEPKPLPPVEVPKGAPKISPAQIAALVAAGLIPSGKAAKIATLLKHGAYSTNVSALEAGLASISWFQLPPGAKLAKKAKAKPVLIASGRLSFAAAGKGVLKLKLTSAGKRLLKHAKRLKLVARGSFTPSGGAAVTATRPFLLKR